MKKYIRTKDGKIYCTDDLVRNEILNRKPFVHKKTKELVYPTYIKQEADTIAELCDAFVVEYKDAFFVYYYYIFAKDSDGIVYGAVLTDKGLIYVAKRNKKGEFKLL